MYNRADLMVKYKAFIDCISVLYCIGYWLLAIFQKLYTLEKSFAHCSPLAQDNQE
jgi:hypothetical protein